MMRNCILIYFLLIINYTSLFGQQTELSIQTGHVAAIQKIVFSPDGILLASSDDQNKICLWDMTGLTQMATFFSNKSDSADCIVQLAFSSDNKQLIVATKSGKVQVWDVGLSKIEFEVMTFSSISKLFLIDNNRCLILSNKLLMLNLKNRLLSVVSYEKLLDIHRNSMSNELYYCTTKGTIGKINLGNEITLQSVDTGYNSVKKQLTRKNAFITQVKLTDDMILLSGAGMLRFYDLKSKSKLYSASMPYLDEKITDLDFVPLKNYFLVSNTDGKIYVYDNIRKKLLTNLKDHISEVNSLAVNPTKNIFASGSSDRSIIIWDANTLKPIKRFYARASSIQCIDLSESNQFLSFGNELGDTKLINLTDKYNEIKTVRNHRQPVNQILFANNDRELFTSSNDNHVSKLSTENMKIEAYQKVKTNFGFKYLINNIILKLNLYVEPYIFIDSFNISADKKYLIVNGYKFKSKNVKKSKKFLAKRTRIIYKGYFEYYFTTDGLEKQKKVHTVRQTTPSMVQYDSTIMGINLYNSENGHIAKITGIEFDQQHNRLITSSKDATIKIWDLKTKKLVITMIPVDKNKRIFITADNYYFAPKNALNAIGFKQGIRFYPPEQFDLKFNRPDIVLDKLNNPDTNLIVLYRKAYEKRLKKSGFTEQMFTSEWHTPELKILNTNNFKYTTDNSEQELKICATDSKYNLDRINVWINDVPLYGINGISLKDKQTDSVTMQVPVLLSAGENKIQVSCFNEKGVESLKESVELFCKPSKAAKPSLYIISMSVSEYKDNRYNLKYAVKDGKDIASMFSSNPSESFSKVYLDTLFNSNATKQNFFKLREKLLQSDVNDEVVVFVSGHGLLNKDMDFYFATFDIDFSDPDVNGISFDDLESLLDSIPARKKLLMMDACHSGEVDKDEAPDQIFASKIESTPDITFRGSVKEYNFKGIDSTTVKSGMNLTNTFELMQELFAGLDKGTGTVVISAAAGKGYALESDKWNNGVFTYSIINGLQNKAADKNKDKKITISELKDYSIKQVELLTGGKQKPTARRESTGFDWRVW